MSLVVKNLKMPANCIECPFSIDDECRALPPTKKQKYPIVWNMRPNWCPLREYNSGDNRKVAKHDTRI